MPNEGPRSSVVEWYNRGVETSVEHDAVEAARRRAAEIIAAAEAEAAALLDDAESRARQRADVVIREAQERLEALHAEEREVRGRLDELREHDPIADEDDLDLTDSRDAVNGIEVSHDSSLADYLKSTLRHELHP